MNFTSMPSLNLLPLFTLFLKKIAGFMQGLLRFIQLKMYFLWFSVISSK